MQEKIIKKTLQRQMTRREFGGALAAAGVITHAPAFLRGQNLNNKLNIAMIACGGRATANMSGDSPRSGRGRGGEAAPPPSGTPTGIPAENITVLCDVDQNAIDAALQKYPKAKTYKDFRKVFDSPNDFDAVMISTTEHTHTLATYLALTHGKHVYCEKPLTHDIWEARFIHDIAAKYPKLATQTGNQGHASPVRRQLKEIIMSGAIGPVREVHVWADRAWGLQDAASAQKFDQPHGFYNGIQIVERFKEEMPVPPKISWDLWIGPAPVRPFHATYLPGPRWYRWWDFGNGTMSDLGGHDNDAAFQVLDLTQPTTCEAVSPIGKPHPELAPATMKVTYEFPARGSAPPVKLIWYQGDVKPPQWVEGKIPQQGRAILFVGDKGMLTTSGGLKLYPEADFKDYKMPPETLPRSPGHYIEWIQACKDPAAPRPGSNFIYSSNVTMSNHLGNVAFRCGKKLEWDPVNLRARNAPEASQYIRRPYRKEWEALLKATT